MDKQALKQQVFADIERRWQESDEALDFLFSLIRLPSRNFQATYAQELVANKLQAMGFALDRFPCAVAEIQDLPDFFSHPGNYHASADIYNLGGVKEGRGDGSFLLFSHIDTGEGDETRNTLTPSVQDGRIYGLGAADDKGGVAMMLLGAEAVLRACPTLDKKLILLSTIGKRGSVGTLTAFTRGYQADAAVYLHPAETGHGFREIKNFSMGLVDFEICVRGQAGVYRDENDTSEVSALLKGCEVIRAIQAWDAQRREKHLFGPGQWQGQPMTKVEYRGAAASELVGDDLLRFDLTISVRFGMDETIDSVYAELTAYLREALADDPWLSQHLPEVKLGERKANPALIPREHPLVQTVEQTINAVKGTGEFIYQYHGSSDIRLPILYGNTDTIGIGPLCGGLDENNGREWLDLQDLCDGIKIVAGLIVDSCFD